MIARQWKVVCAARFTGGIVADNWPPRLAGYRRVFCLTGRSDGVLVLSASNGGSIWRSALAYMIGFQWRSGINLG